MTPAFKTEIPALFIKKNEISNSTAANEYMIELYPLSEAASIGLRKTPTIA